MRSEQLSSTISLSLQDCWCTQHFLTTVKTHFMGLRKYQNANVFDLTGEKDRKAIKTRERHYFLKVTQRYGREWKLRSVLIKPDISDIIIMPSLSLFCTFQKGHTRWFVIWTSTIIYHMPVLGGTWWILKAKVAWHSAGNNNVIQALGLFVQ